MIDVDHPPNSFVLTAMIWQTTPAGEPYDLATHTFRSRAEVEAFQRRLFLLKELTWPRQRANQAPLDSEQPQQVRRHRLPRRRRAEA